MTAIFANLGYFYAIVFLITIASCVHAKTEQALIAAIILFLLFSTGWIPSLWNDPFSMSIAHLGIMVLMLALVHGKYSGLMLGLIMTALVADAAWAVMPSLDFPDNFLHFPRSIFWWQSILNLLFFFQCIVTIIRCYTSPEINVVGHDSYYARIVETARGTTREH